jgi:PAS domain-containing protein
MLDPNGYVLTWILVQRIKVTKQTRSLSSISADSIPEAVQAGWPEHELHVAAEQGRFEDEGWRVRKDGSQLWANVVISALHDDSGRLRGFAKLTRDLSERKRAETLRAQGSSAMRCGCGA